jgi:phenylalanyl-tRNA synthetase beta chain
MPTVEFNFKELCNFLGRNYKPDELKDKISMLGIDLERIGHENVIMEIFPNRPDLLSVEGFSRALKGVLDIEVGLKNYPVKKSNVKIFVEKSVGSVRPFIAAGMIKNVSIDENFLISLMDIQEKLHLTHGRNRKKVAIGLHDLSKVSPPFFYKAVSPKEISFVPLDFKKELNLEEILREHPKGREYSFILEKKQRYPIILDKRNEVLSFPPIINGELTRVSAQTEDIFIDVTGLEEDAVEKALNILVTAIADRSGELYSVEIINPR